MNSNRKNKAFWRRPHVSEKPVYFIQPSLSLQEALATLREEATLRSSLEMMSIDLVPSQTAQCCHDVFPRPLPYPKRNCIYNNQA